MTNSRHQSGHQSSMLGPAWIELVPAHPMDARSDWDLGNLEVDLPPCTLYPVPQDISKLYSSCGRVHCPAGRTTAIREGPRLRGCSWSAVVFGWVLCLRLHPHECHELKVPQQNIALQHYPCDLLHLSVVLMLWLISLYHRMLCR